METAVAKIVKDGQDVTPFIEIEVDRVLWRGSFVMAQAPLATPSVLLSMPTCTLTFQEGGTREIVVHRCSGSPLRAHFLNAQ